MWDSSMATHSVLQLQLHMKYHRDVRDEQCPLCDKAFHEHKTLKTHLLKIHNVDNMRGNVLTSGQTLTSRRLLCNSIVSNARPLISLVLVLITIGFLLTE